MELPKRKCQSIWVLCDFERITLKKLITGQLSIESLKLNYKIILNYMLIYWAKVAQNDA